MFPDQASNFLLTQLTGVANRFGASLRATAVKLDGAAPDVDAAYEFASEWLRQGAWLFDRTGLYFESVEGEELVADFEALTRRKPWTVGIGALALGFSFGRLLKGAQPGARRG